MRAWQVIKDLLLAVVAIALVVTAILAVHLQVGVIAITSESMAPTLRTGDTALTMQVSRHKVEEGDILVLPHPEDASFYYAHRVVAVDQAVNRVRIETKGDANPIKDSWTLELKSDEVPRVAFTMATSRLPLDLATRARLSQGLFLVAVFALVMSLPKTRAKRARARAPQ